MIKRLFATALVATSLAGCANTHKDDEIKVNLNEIPAAAREGLMRESNGAPLTDVEKETENGLTYYEAKTTANGQKWEIQVDPNGKLLKKQKDD